MRLTAPPVDGRANEAVRRLLAAWLNLSVSAVRIVAGERRRNKRISVAGASKVEIAALLA